MKTRSLISLYQIKTPWCQWPANSSVAGRAPARTLVSQAQRSPGQGDEHRADDDIPSAERRSEASSDGGNSDIRLPRSVQSAYLRPLKRKAYYGIPACDLQLRSYSVRNLEFFADFTLRAAYYLKLATSGPTPLPRIVERWTVPRSNFVHKKSQENFERKTLRRLIQIRDGHPDTINVWLAFIKKHSYYGIGMKANIWQFDALDARNDVVAATGDADLLLDKSWQKFGYTNRRDVPGGLGALPDRAGSLRIDDSPFQPSP